MIIRPPSMVRPVVNHAYAPLFHEICQAVPNSAWLAGQVPLSNYWSAGRQIFFQGDQSQPSYFEVMRGLGQEYQVYRMEVLRGGFLVFNRPWIEGAPGDLHAQLARDEDLNLLKLIRVVEERNDGRMKTPALHHTEPITPFNPHLRGFDIFEWMNRHWDRFGPPVRPESLGQFDSFLKYHPTLARAIQHSLPYVTAMDLVWLEKILSSVAGHFEEGSFVFSGVQSEGVLKHVVGKLAEWRLRERVVQDYHQMLRTTDPQTILLFKPEIFLDSGRSFADVLIARIDPKDCQMFLLRLYELSLSEALAVEDIQEEQGRWDFSRDQGVVVKQLDGSWERFDARPASSLDFVAYGLPEEAHAEIREEARQILEEAIFALNERDSVAAVPQSTPHRLPRIQTEDPYDYFQKMGWETVEVAWASGKGGRILTALLRWVSFQIWQGLPPMTQGGKRLKTISPLGVPQCNAVRQFIESGVGPNYFTKLKVPHKRSQEHLVQFLVMGGLAEEIARELVKAMYWMEWGWETLSQSKGKSLFPSYFVAMVRNAAFKLWGGNPSFHIREHEEIKGVQRKGISKSHPIRSLLREGLIFEKNVANISLLDYQADVTKVLVMAGMSEAEAKKIVRQLYYYLWGWESVEGALVSGDARRILVAHVREAAFTLWGGIPPSHLNNRQVSSGLSKEAVSIRHPLRRLLKDGVEGWWVPHGGRLSLKNYKKELEELLILGGLSSEKAHEIVEAAFRGSEN